MHINISVNVPQQRFGGWNSLVLVFLALSAVASLVSFSIGLYVFPIIHETHDMRPHVLHPSFNAPVAVLRKHNQDHKAEFENAYHFPKQSEALEVHPKKKVVDNSKKYHMVFSTSCSPFQNWQALAFFYFAHKVRQPGTVTRLVSGCTDQEAEELRKVHSERVVPLQIPGLQTFEMHVTPNFDGSNGGDQKYFNKPNGLLHWMENYLGFSGKSDHEDLDSIIIIVDPDMMLLRPITEDFTSINYVGGWVDSKNIQNHIAQGNPMVDYQHDVVTHGKPHAQRYAYGPNWLTAVQDHLEEIVGPDSPVLTMSENDANDFYPAGPPYVATGRDMYEIALHWVKFLPKYHKHFDKMMCEMHSYSLAAAHLRLPHKLAHGFMVSDQESFEENFDFVEKKMTKANVCMKPPNLVPADSKIPMDPTDSTTMTDVAYETDRGIPIRELPFVLHYCQRYALGRYFFSKYKLKEDAFDNCEGPLMVEPPGNVAEVYDWSIFPNGIEKYDFSEGSSMIPDVRDRMHMRNGWLLCAVITGINEAITAYKNASCGTDEKYFRKAWHFHQEDDFNQSIRDPSNPFAKKRREENGKVLYRLVKKEAN